MLSSYEGGKARMDLEIYHPLVEVGVGKMVFLYFLFFIFFSISRQGLLCVPLAGLDLLCRPG